MPKGGLLVNTARKEVINEAELIQLMEERTDLKYMTDIMPAANETFAAKFAGRYFSTPKKIGGPDCRSQYQRRYCRCQADCRLPERRLREVPRKQVIFLVGADYADFTEFLFSVQFRVICA